MSKLDEIKDKIRSESYSRDAKEDIKYLLNELKNANFILALKAMENNGEIRILPEFIMDYSHNDVETEKVLEPWNNDVIYKFRFK